ncbi:hypothetical protein J437_LFUL000074 [Ladona fulva]|uniref:Ig-like domain-containing protein n=1 Tax=Ladona fulva TaxID=123851 RepID=A0A8K0NUH9_LADFU|nr:hypothetical protein J437_LFUL000074 [Ladona fulva]
MPSHTRLSSSEGLPPLEGPVFLLEPPSTLVFSNSTGGTISCTAHGSPPPDIRWIDNRGKELVNMPRVRLLSDKRKEVKVRSDRAENRLSPY